MNYATNCSSGQRTPTLTTTPRSIRLGAMFPLILVIFVAPFLLNAQQAAETLPYFASGQAFDAHGIDSVNLYNGDLNATIPLGMPYTLGPTGFQWQLFATSSVKFWHFSTSSCGGTTHYAWLAGDPTLGVGWTLQPEYVVKRAAGPKWEYYAPDGSAHNTGLTATVSQAVTVDGSHLRTTSISSPTPSFTVEFPDGTLETFSHQYAPPDTIGGSSVDFSNLDTGEAVQTRFGLSTIQDKFGNILVTVNWSTTPSEIASINLTPFGATSKIVYNWKNYVVGSVTWRVLDYLTFPAPGGKQLKVLFSYLPGTFNRNNYDTSNGTGCSPSGLTVSIPELTSVTMSDPTTTSIVPFSYGVSYWSAALGTIQRQGAISQLTLPALGTIQYDYAITAGLPCAVSVDCDPNGAGPASDPGSPDFEPALQDHSPGVSARTEYDPFTNRSASTTYARKAFNALTNGLVDPNKSFRRATVVAPGGDESSAVSYARRYYFHVDNSAGTQINADGIELDRRYYGTADPTQLAIRSIISCYIGQCGYQDAAGNIYQYSMPASLNGGRTPPEAVVTWYGVTAAAQNGGVCTASYSPRCEKTANTVYNATAGRYNTTTLTTTLPDAVTRTADVNWTPITSPGWILDVFDHRFTADSAAIPPNTSDGQSAVREYFDFDGANGFLKGSRIWDSAAGTVVMNCNYNGGNGTVSGRFSQTYSSGVPLASNCPGAMPAIGSDSDTFGQDQTFDKLLLTQANWRSGSGTIGWNLLDLSRDSLTGYVMESRDPNYSTMHSALKVIYTYDALGRIAMVQPSGGWQVLNGRRRSVICPG